MTAGARTCLGLHRNLLVLALLTKMLLKKRIRQLPASDDPTFAPGKDERYYQTRTAQPVRHGAPVSATSLSLRNSLNQAAENRRRQDLLHPMTCVALQGGAKAHRLFRCSKRHRFHAPPPPRRRSLDGGQVIPF